MLYPCGDANGWEEREKEAEREMGVFRNHRGVFRARFMDLADRWTESDEWVDGPEPKGYCIHKVTSLIDDACKKAIAEHREKCLGKSQMPGR
ncbi:MAG: hypothetical protein ACM3NH_02475 [Candidatus Saccharibacteria bacterium]